MSTAEPTTMIFRLSTHTSRKIKRTAPKREDDGNGFITKYSPGGGSYVYSTYLGASVETSLSAIAVGPDSKVYVTGEYDAVENITVNGGSGGSQVTITSPANYGTVSSPVTFAASATTTCSGGIYALQIYTDPGVLAYTAYASSVNQAISLSAGYYYGAVQAWDNFGGTFKTNVQFQVQDLPQ
jgi:hypothetical protein